MITNKNRLTVMRTALYFVLLTAMCIVVAPANADVCDTATERLLFLTAGSPVVGIPREDWVFFSELRPGDTVVYYMLTSEKRQMSFSVFIDKTSICQSSEECLTTALKNPKYKDAKDLQKSDAGPFKIAQFFLPFSAHLKQAHILASAYVNGHWIDVHISKAGPEPEMEQLLEFLKLVTLK